MQIKIYTDPNANSMPVFAKYKGKTTMDIATAYAPYIPMLQTDRIVSQGKLQGWTTFTLYNNNSEIVKWCKENLGKQHRGIYLAKFNLWLGNGGRWRCDYRKGFEIGLRPPYIRIWVKHESDIALFKMRWG